MSYRIITYMTSVAMLEIMEDTKYRFEFLLRSHPRIEYPLLKIVSQDLLTL